MDIIKQKVLLRRKTMIGTWILEEIEKIGKPIITIVNQNHYHSICAKCGTELRAFVEGRNDDINILWIEPCPICTKEEK
jgi:hypothetical protein